MALDHLEEDRRPVLCRLREDLKQVAVVVPVGEDPQPLQVVVVLRDLTEVELSPFTSVDWIEPLDEPLP